MLIIQDKIGGQNNGYSITELMVVLAIIRVLVLLALPGLFPL